MRGPRRHPPLAKTARGAILGHSLHRQADVGFLSPSEFCSLRMTCMKVLLVHPGLLPSTGLARNLRLEPLGLEIVAEAARRSNHEVKLIDMQVESDKRFRRMLLDSSLTSSVSHAAISHMFRRWSIVQRVPKRYCRAPSFVWAVTAPPSSQKKS